MTDPLPLPYLGPGMSPLQLYLRGEKGAMNTILAALEDASAEAARLFIRLEAKHGIGSVVERAQLAMIRRELTRIQTDLWRAIGKDIRSAAPDIALAAATAEKQVEQVLFHSVLGQDVPEDLLRAQQEYARATVNTYLARGENGIGLSKRVYNTQKLAAGLVDRQINRSLLLGQSWRDLAKAVTPLIRPDVPGGVSYAAKRLARTELNNAFHTANIQSAEANPWVESQKWNLSRSHPKRDKCDDLASGHTKGLKEGHYALGQVPGKPHPQCLCYLTSETVSEEQFFDSLLGTTPSQLARSYRQAASA